MPNFFFWYFDDNLELWFYFENYRVYNVLKQSNFHTLAPLKKKLIWENSYFNVIEQKNSDQKHSLAIRCLTIEILIKSSHSGETTLQVSRIKMSVSITTLLHTNVLIRAVTSCSLNKKIPRETFYYSQNCFLDSNEEFYDIFNWFTKGRSMSFLFLRGTTWPWKK